MDFGAFVAILLLSNENVVVNTDRTDVELKLPLKIRSGFRFRFGDLLEGAA